MRDMESQESIPQAYVASPATVNDPSWYVDSGATDHVTADLNNFSLRADYKGKEKLTIGNGNSVRGRQLLNDRKIADELGTTLKYNKKTGLPGFLSKNGINQSINSKEGMVKTGGEIISGKTGKIINKYVPGMNNTEFMKSIIKSHTPTSKKILIKAKSLLR